MEDAKYGRSDTQQSGLVHENRLLLPGHSVAEVNRVGTANMPTHGFARVCRGRKICEPHTVLKGQSPSGVFWTLIAEPYPELMCRALARCTCTGVQERRAAPLARILDR